MSGVPLESYDDEPRDLVAFVVFLVSLALCLVALMLCGGCQTTLAFASLSDEWWAGTWELLVAFVRDLRSLLGRDLLAVAGGAGEVLGCGSRLRLVREAEHVRGRAAEHGFRVG